MPGSLEYLERLYKELYGIKKAGRKIKEIPEGPYKLFYLIYDADCIY